MGVTMGVNMDVNIVVRMDVFIRGVQKNKKIKTALAQKLIRFLYCIESTV